MKVLRGILCGLIAVTFVGIGDTDVQAQEGKWGVGGYAGLNIPMRNLRDRWGNKPKYGGTLSYVASRSITVEIEYHFSDFDNGNPAATPFTWAIDGLEYEHRRSNGDRGRSDMTFHSFLVNGLLFLGEENSTRGFKAKDYRFYLSVGGGFYRYKSINEGLVNPQQAAQPINIDTAVPGGVLETQIDQRFAYGGNLGAGLEAFVTDNMSVDLRARYHFIVGELRPILRFDIERTRPMMNADLNAQIKFYFWR
jgi:opacity protein-like surface antigen